MSVQISDWLIGIGAVLMVTGVAYKMGMLGWLGNLPGDIRYKGEHTTIYFPIITMILISIILSAIVALIRR